MWDRQIGHVPVLLCSRSAPWWNSARNQAFKTFEQAHVGPSMEMYSEHFTLKMPCGLQKSRTAKHVATVFGVFNGSQWKHQRSTGWVWTWNMSQMHTNSRNLETSVKPCKTIKPLLWQWTIDHSSISDVACSVGISDAQRPGTKTSGCKG